VQHILLVSGTRPEIVKLAPLYHALRAASWTDVQWLHTGQHDEMAQQILSCLDIVPDIRLRRCGSTLSKFAAGCRQQLDALMARRPWSVVVVQGDTESAFVGALAAFHNRVVSMTRSSWPSRKPRQWPGALLRDPLDTPRVAQPPGGVVDGPAGLQCRSCAAG
jgi:hypothetical protein